MSDLDVSTETASVDTEPIESDEPTAERTADGELLVREGDIAADYLERFLDIIDYDGDIDLDVENDRASSRSSATTCSPWWAATARRWMRCRN